MRDFSNTEFDWSSQEAELPDDLDGRSENKSSPDPDASAGRSGYVEHPPPPPKLDVKLPPHPRDAQPSKLEAANYSKSMMASSAVSAFLMPIVALCLGGYWADQKMKHQTPWLSMAGVVVGLGLGVASLIRVLDRLSK